MTDEERETNKEQYAEARRILLLLNDRLADYLETRGRALDLSRVTGGGSGQRRAPALDAREAWCIDVGWALYAYGTSVAYLLHARLTRRQKSSNNSWSQIASEMDDTEEHTKETFRRALPMFLMQIEFRGVGIRMREGEEALPSEHALRCAATEHGHPCAA